MRPCDRLAGNAGRNLTIAASIVDRDEGAGRIGLPVPLCAVTDHSFDTGSYREHADGKFLTADDMRWYGAHYLADPADGADPLVSVLRADLDGMPPALVVTAGLDPLRGEGEAYAQRLVEAGTTTRLVRFDEMIHAFAVLSAFPEEQATLIADVAVDTTSARNPVAIGATDERWRQIAWDVTALRRQRPSPSNATARRRAESSRVLGCCR